MYGQTGTDVSSQLNIGRQAATVSWMKALGPKTVLCVDDEKIGLRVRKILLESHGFKVLTASSGAQGLALLENHHVDLVVLDYYMPGLNGGQVAPRFAAAAPAFPSFSCLHIFLFRPLISSWPTPSSPKAILPTY